jgi:hypothetical protein
MSVLDGMINTMDLPTLTEYIKIHRTSLIQDNAKLIQDTNSPEWNFLQGQIIGVEHILGVIYER